MMKKYVNWGLFVVFLLFAYLQLNDPDPLIWVMVYGIVALFFAVSNFFKIPKIVFYTVILAMVLFSLMHFGFFTEWLKSDDKSELVGEMIYEKPYIEGTREFMGLLIAIVALIYLSRQNSKVSE